MRASDWYVEEYASTGTQAIYRQHFSDCTTLVEHIRTRTLALRAGAKMRVHIPQSATIAERQKIRDAGGAVL